MTCDNRGVTNDPMDQPEDDGYSLVMPFVVVASNGGTFDDAAFAAGWQCGDLDRRLATIKAAGGEFYRTTLRKEIIPQADLIAMHHGFKMSTEDFEDAEEWTAGVFTASGLNLDGGE